MWQLRHENSLWPKWHLVWPILSNLKASYFLLTKKNPNKSNPFYEAWLCLETAWAEQQVPNHFLL